jgi:hypothetical protein
MEFVALSATAYANASFMFHMKHGHPTHHPSHERVECSPLRLRLGPIWAKARAGAFLGVQATGIGALGIDGTQAGLCVQKLAIAIGTAGHRKNAVFVVEAVDEFGFLQAFGNPSRVFVLGLKRIDQAQTHQVRQTYL